MPILRLDGDARGAVKATQDVTRGLQGTDRQFNKTSQSARQLEREAAKIVRENEGPQQRYNRLLERMGQVLAADKLSLDQAYMAARRYHTELQRGQWALRNARASALVGWRGGVGGGGMTAGAAAAAADRRAAAIGGWMGGVGGGWNQPLPPGEYLQAARLAQLVDRQEQAARGYNKMARGARHADSAMGGLGRTLGRFVGFTAGGIAIGSMIGLVASLRQEVTKMREEYGAAKTSGVAAQFAVLEKDPQKAMAAYSRESLRIRGSGAVATMSEADQVFQAMRGAELSRRDRDYLVYLKQQRAIENIEGLAQGISAFQATHPELSAKQLVGMALVGAETGTSRMDRLMQVAAGSAAVGGRLGWSPQFSMVATGILDKALASVEKGGERLEQYMNQLLRFGMQEYPELVGQDPISTLRKIGALGLAHPELQGKSQPEILKYLEEHGTDQQLLESIVGRRVQAGQALYIMLQNMGPIEEKMRTATTEGPRLAKQFGRLPGRDPMLGPSIALSRTQAEYDVLSEKQSQAESLYQSMWNEVATYRKREYQAGRGSVWTMMANASARNVYPFLAAWMGPDAGVERFALRQVEKSGTAYGVPLSETLLEKIAIHLESMDAKATPQRVMPAPTGRQE